MPNAINRNIKTPTIIAYITVPQKQKKMYLMEVSAPIQY